MNEELPQQNKTNKGFSINWQKLLRTFLPLFIFAAISPYLLSVAFRFTSAERANEVRLWFEPESVITAANQPTQLLLYADFADTTRLINGLIIEIDSPSLVLNQTQINFTKPFQGTVVLGEINISAPETGEYFINLQNIKSDLKDLNYITQPAKIIVN